MLKNVVQKYDIKSVSILCKLCKVDLCLYTAPLWEQRFIRYVGTEHLGKWEL